MQIITDILFLSFFTFLLVCVFRFRPGYLKYYPASFKRISLGIIIFILILTAQIASDFSGFASAPYLKASIWCGFILGGLSVIWGFFHLFSTGSRSYSDFLHRIRQLVCIKAISSIPNPAKSYEQLLKESLNKLMDIMKYKMGVVFKPSFNSHDMILVGYWGVAPERVRVLPLLPEDNSFYKEAAMSRQVVVYDEVTALPEYNSLFTDEDKIGSFVSVPLKFGDKILGVVGLYDANPKRFVYQETLFLSSVGKLLGVMAEESLISKRNKGRREYICIAEKISRLFQTDIPKEEAFPRMAKLLNKVIEFDYLALAVTDPSGENMDNISVGTGGNILVNKERSLPTRGTAVFKVVESGKPLVQKEIEYGKYVEDNLLKAMGIRSRLILPLSRHGALTLGSMKTGQYMSKDAKWLSLIGSILSDSLLKYEMSEKMTKMDNLLLKFKEITEKTLKGKETKKVLSDIARDITKELPTSFCRISFMEGDKNSLRTCVSEKIRDQGIELKEDRKHPLSLLPWHRMVLETGKTMLVNQEDPESLMPDEECEEIMSRDLRSGLLVPIVVDQNPVGVLSIGEMRSWNRRPFRQEEVAFVKSLTNQIPLLLERDHKSPSLDLTTGPQGEEELNRLGFEINSSLSAIYGSVELLKSKKKGMDEETSKYLDLIQKGGQRIQKAMKNSLEPQVSEKPSVQKESKKEKVTV